MKKQESLAYILILGTAVALSGCVVRTYPLTKDRIDQDLTAGNRGYLKGNAPAASEEKERKTTRTTQAIEIELRSPIKFEKTAKAPQAVEEPLITGNRGFVNQAQEAPAPQEVSFEKYTVQKGDTLQKISMKFYGTTKKWTKIYDANRDTLKGPDKIYPGRSINIPVESPKEPQGNLK